LAEKAPRARNYDEVADLVAKRVTDTLGRISAKRLLPAARAAGYGGSARNFRRLVADAKSAWRQQHPRGRRPGVWAPGETLIIDWGVLGGVHVFCAWCGEVNAVTHSEICAIPAERLEIERGLLAALPSLRPDLGAKPTTRKVDKLSCIRFASGRYSVPNRLIGRTVTMLVEDKTLRVIEPVTGEVFAEHTLVAPGETSIIDEHYGGARPDKPRRAARPRTASEKAFGALGPVAEAFLTGAAAAGVTKLTSEITEILTLQAAHGTDPLLAALERAVAFSRWRAADVGSILATNGHAPQPRPAGQALVLTLPAVPTRSLDAYRIDGGDVS
jgi:hypothetical protein